jgi:hypothetical protein
MLSALAFLLRLKVTCYIVALTTAYWQSKHLSINTMTQAITFLTGFREMIRPIVTGEPNNMTEIVPGFPQFSQANTEIVRLFKLL